MSRIAITGGTGFVGRHLAARLRGEGHEVVLVGRRAGIDVSDEAALAQAFARCDAVVHCAGINREIGRQTYQLVHIVGTRAVVNAARSAGVPRLVMISFLRARPNGPTAYHRSKWAAEELVRGSGLSWTVVKAGVIHGRGDHMLDHLSRAFQTFPIFALVGFRDRLIRPVAISDVARLLGAAALGDPRLENQTVVALGPEELSLSDAVRRVADVVGRRPIFVRLPIIVHRLLGFAFEASMRVPLLSRAQVEILAEGVVEALPFGDSPPNDLAPRTPFSASVIRSGLPPAGGFGRRDLRWCVRSG